MLAGAIAKHRNFLEASKVSIQDKMNPSSNDKIDIIFLPGAGGHKVGDDALQPPHDILVIGIGSYD